jgi:hypothetical protein
MAFNPDKKENPKILENFHEKSEQFATTVYPIYEAPHF